VASSQARLAALVNGNYNARIRIVSGLVLFAFAATHLLNHALGLISIDVMETVREVRVALWRSPPGTIALYGALILHMVLALARFARRRTWRLRPAEMAQLVFGLAIPLLLIRHMLGTRMAHEVHGIDDNYAYALWAMWPSEAVAQAVLIFLVWVHGTIGLYSWLRLKPWFAPYLWPGFAAAVLVPVLAYAGFSVAGREAARAGDYVNPYTPEQALAVQGAMAWSVWIAAGVIAAVLAVRLGREALERVRPRVRISYPDGRKVMSAVGPTLLEISRNNNIAHASVCGGRGRCSTCRVRIIEGDDAIEPPGDIEKRVLERVGAGEKVRLACQVVPRTDLAIAPLLPFRRATPLEIARHDKYLWGLEQPVSVMFADIRDFTSFSEAKLPYDVVFVLNQYLSQMSEAIEDQGGYVDKYIGDGIMALFGMESCGPARGQGHGRRARCAQPEPGGGPQGAVADRHRHPHRIGGVGTCRRIGKGRGGRARHRAWRYGQFGEPPGGCDQATCRRARVLACNRRGRRHRAARCQFCGDRGQGPPRQAAGLCGETGGDAGAMSAVSCHSARYTRSRNWRCRFRPAFAV